MIYDYVVSQLVGPVRFIVIYYLFVYLFLYLFILFS